MEDLEKVPGEGWFCQPITDHDWVYDRIGRPVAAGRTPYQTYRIWESPALGRCVALDGDLQSTELDRATYHEALVHPVLLLHPRPRRVLICGGGEGATAREVLKHPSVEHVVMVDIDRDFTAACREHLPEWSGGAFENPRLELRHEDVFDYVKAGEPRFDAVIGDLTDCIEEVAPGRSFHSPAFYRSLERRVRPGGVLSTQAGALALFDHARHAHIRGAVAQVFPHTASYRAPHDSFFVPWSFVVASASPLPGPAEWIPHLTDELEERGIELEHFDGPSLGACFLLERRIRTVIEAI